jgi:hypothetical protein
VPRQQLPAGAREGHFAGTGCVPLAALTWQRAEDERDESLARLSAATMRRLGLRAALAVARVRCAPRQAAAACAVAATHCNCVLTQRFSAPLSSRAQAVAGAPPHAAAGAARLLPSSACAAAAGGCRRVHAEALAAQPAAESVPTAAPVRRVGHAGVPERDAARGTCRCSLRVPLTPRLLPPPPCHTQAA